MSLQIDVVLRGEILLVTVTGSVGYDPALRLYKQMFDTAAEKHVHKILVNTLAMDGDLSPLERYHLGVQAAAYLKQRKMNPRLAIVGKPPEMDGLGVGVARNRKVTAEAFPSEQDALTWLDIGRVGGRL
jgi:hypothetical protein